MLRYAIYASFIIILLVISLYDIKYKKIPSKFVVLLGIIAILSALFNDDILLMNRLVGTLIISVILIIVRVLSKGGIGGGDIKLMAVSGFMLGLKNIINATFFGIILAGIVVIIFLIFGKIKRKSNIPFGPFLSIGIISIILFDMI